MAQMNLPTEKKQTHGHGEQTYGCQGEGEGVGWIRSLGLIDADYCLWNGLAMRSCCVTLDTVSSHKMEQENVRKKECIHVCVAGSPCCMTEEKIMHWEIKTK